MRPAQHLCRDSARGERDRYTETQAIVEPGISVKTPAALSSSRRDFMMGVTGV